ncbi:hypothetical protein FSP39_023492 [Pinctada imbricata]|uniref:Condensin complex subunit 2 n=1 Tax=Pinctada imbricata TaxID=66713 RepID=A0AA88YG45_PINIB|nr:hypothetical protein FSP39_023492 [Pinctada imbricata]
MPSHREVLSPLTTPNIPQHSLSSRFISPSTSRHVSLKSPVPMLTAEHDDAAEKRERRRSRIIQLQQSAASPLSPTDKYKINAKNAFGLHLIDYMSDLVKKKELDNFQVASTTLDASAKIYAGRVDAIHAETYKVLTGLGREKDKTKEDDEGKVYNEDENIEGTWEGYMFIQIICLTTKKNHTIESNLKNISVNKIDLEFEVDPLFQMMSAAFDEGGSSGLLLNNLRCFDDQQELVLDSSSSTDPAYLHPEGFSQPQPIELAEIKTLFRGVDIGSRDVCPSFSSFDFTDWDISRETSILPSASQSSTSAHVFDMNAEPEPIIEADGDMDDVPFNSDFPGDGMSDHEGNADGDDGESRDDGHSTDKSMFIGDGKAAQLMQSAIRDLTHGTTGTLLSVLASEPSDYSYFNKSLLRTWAGPSHWRLAPLSKDPRFKGIVDKSQKAKKPVFKIDYDAEKEFTNYLKPSKATTLTTATLTKYSKDKNTLPKDLHYDADKLFRLFCKSKLMIKRQDTSSSNIVDDDIENYDYENTNDRENFCPKEGVEMDNDDDGGDFDFNFTQAGENCSQESNDFTQADATMNNTILGDKLVSQPNKVAKIDIDYAKTAKKLDVKKLKGVIWNLLTSKQKTADTDKTTERMEEGGGDNQQKPEVTAGTSNDKEMGAECSFQEILTQLPQNVSNQMARNISTPIAFVCLLHLANEKCLKIESDNMTDLKISQDHY